LEVLRASFGDARLVDFPDIVGRLFAVEAGHSGTFDHGLLLVAL
jgi:hypothetical protein